MLLDWKQVLDASIGQKLRGFRRDFWEGLELAVDHFIRLHLTGGLLFAGQTHFV